MNAVRQYVAFVGAYALKGRLEVDLQRRIERDRRIIRVPHQRDVYLLHGMRGPQVKWVDLGADAYQRDYCMARCFDRVTLEEAKAILDQETQQ